MVSFGRVKHRQSTTPWPIVLFNFKLRKQYVLLSEYLDPIHTSIAREPGYVWRTCRRGRLQANFLPNYCDDEFLMHVQGGFY